MIIATLVQQLIDAEPKQLHTSEGDLRPMRRLHIYDAFGPTNPPETLSARVDLLDRAINRLTTVDRVRVRLTIPTAEKVRHIWETGNTAVDPEDLPEIPERPDGGLPNPRWQISFHDLPSIDLAGHAIELARAILDDDVDITRVFEEACVLEHTTDEDPPWGGAAAAEALYAETGSFGTSPIGVD